MDEGWMELAATDTCGKVAEATQGGHCDDNCDNGSLDGTADGNYVRH